jgi:hypothetical protein
MQHLVGAETVQAANVFWQIKNPAKKITDKIVFVAMIPPLF